MGIVQTVNYSGYSVSAYKTTKSVLQVETAKEIKEVSEAEKLAEYKKKIWQEIDAMPWGSDVSIQITDEAFEKMMNDGKYEDKIMNILREDACGSNTMCGGIVITIDKNGYRGFSWMEFYEKEGKAGVEAHSKNSFYSKKFSDKPDYMELWEKRRAERELRQQELDKEYVDRLYRSRSLMKKEQVSAVYEANIMEAALQE